MKKRKLGKFGPEVSAIGIGAMSFSDFYGPTDEAQSHQILTAALDGGITHLDTANVYGTGCSESAIGTFLSKQGKRKNDLFSIATKAGISKDAQSGKRMFDNSKAHLQSELEGSLKRLGVESVDLFYIHRRDPKIPIEEVTETLASFQSEGKIKSFGFSEIAPSSLKRASKIHHVGAVQSEYSLSVRSPELGLLQMTKDLGTAFVAFSPLGRSLLTDRPHMLDKVQEVPWLRTNPRFQEPNLSFNLRATDPFRALAAELNTSAAALAIAWLLHKYDHVIPIPGTRFVKHLNEHLDGMHFELSEQDITRIEEVLPIGWAHGDRYSLDQWIGPEKYC